MMQPLTSFLLSEPFHHAITLFQSSDYRLPPPTDSAVWLECEFPSLLTCVHFVFIMNIWNTVPLVLATLELWRAFHFLEPDFHGWCVKLWRPLPEDRYPTTIMACNTLLCQRVWSGYETTHTRTLTSLSWQKLWAKASRRIWILTLSNHSVYA